MRTANAMRRMVHLIGAAALVLCQPANAEDIDLFVQPASPDGDAPNVLIIVDNTANWSRNVDGQSIFINEKLALVRTLENLPVNIDGSARFRVGVMMSSESGGGNKNPDGGYVRAAIRPMTLPNKTTYAALFNSFLENPDKGNGGKAGKVMAEAYLYYDGAAPYAGNNKVKSDYTGNTDGTAQSNAVYALPDNALPRGAPDARSGTPYNSPIVPESCAPNYIIYIGNGPSQDNTSDTNAARTLLRNAATAAGYSTTEAEGFVTEIPISPSDSQRNLSDEWARFMKLSPHRITTYTVDVDPGTTGQGPGWTANMKSMANASGGKYFAVTSASSGTEISDALGTIFSEIQAVNSVFASVSLPLSVSTQGTYLNQLYVGMFRPDKEALPRWVGNMKQYRLGVVDGVLTTVDADGFNVANTATGFISECARSYWTSEDSYWAFRPMGNCIRDDADPRSNSPDGNITEKGAQAQVLRSATARNVKTCNSFTCPTTPTALPNFADGNTSITAAMLGAADPIERTALINYQLGRDVNDEDIDATTTGEMRASAHGDVVHSRPVAINYGTDASPEVVVFYGGNDGVLRAINGNRSTEIGPPDAEVDPGQELWAFVAPEFFGNIKRLRDNVVPISYTGSTTTSPVPQPKPYGLDGSITAYKFGPTTWIYSTARRGGRVVYAFDMSTIHTDTSSPRLLWKIGCPNLGNDTGCTTGFSGIGQTWSAPKVLKTAGYGSGTAPMLMMGGGYDNCEDGDPHTCTASSKGRSVYLLDAETGAKLNEFPTDRPVAADVFVVPDTVSGLAKFAYIVDLGGNIYRISGSSPNVPIGTALPADWTITKIASLGCSTPAAACAANRKFMFAPDVVEPPAPGSGVYHLLVGSGDREKPLRVFDDALGVSNYFFMVKDVPTNATWLSDETADCGEGVICLNSLTPITTVADPAASDLATSKGWYLGLTSGEQVVTSAITVFGVVTFSTHEPTDPDRDSCEADLGTARVYNIGYLNATSRNGTSSRSRFEVVSGGGLPPSPVAGLVRLDPSSPPIPFIIGADPECPLCGSEPTPPSVSTQPKSLTYWYLQQ
jgi:type IV pilus assembly protein PilY1